MVFHSMGFIFFNSEVILSSIGLYPVVGWKIGGETVYLAEGNAAGCGTAMDWGHKMGG